MHEVQIHAGNGLQSLKKDQKYSERPQNLKNDDLAELLEEDRVQKIMGTYKKIRSEFVYLFK